MSLGGRLENLDILERTKGLLMKAQDVSKILH